MPTRAKRPCRHPGCPALTDYGWCGNHAGEANRLDRERRGSSTERGYDGRWDKARRAFLMENPLCAECDRQGFVTAAVCVDHIIPHRGDPLKFWDEAGNWQSLCASCHNAKTARGE